MREIMPDRPLTVCDISLRDGNHAIKHQLSRESLERYCHFAETAGIPYLEVGHGNGLGASSLLIGESLESDEVMLTVASGILNKTRLGVHVIPGFATIRNHIAKAIDYGVDIFRMAALCTEANMTRVGIEFLKKQDKVVWGVLMMTPLVGSQVLLEQAKLMESYGADVLIIMDSTGSYLPQDVKERIETLVEGLKIPVGFHAHNNLGCAVANSIMAVQSGASHIDACIRGFGAGAGNTALEMLIPALEMSGFITGIDFEKVILEADSVMDYLIPTAPLSEPINVLTGIHKLFSGFSKQIKDAARQYDIPYTILISELSRRKLVAGQEDLIVEAAQNLKANSENHESQT